MRSPRVSAPVVRLLSPATRLRHLLAILGDASTRPTRAVVSSSRRTHSSRSWWRFGALAWNASLGLGHEVRRYFVEEARRRVVHVEPAACATMRRSSRGRCRARVIPTYASGVLPRVDRAHDRAHVREDPSSSPSGKTTGNSRPSRSATSSTRHRFVVVDLAVSDTGHLSRNYRRSRNCGQRRRDRTSSRDALPIRWISLRSTRRDTRCLEDGFEQGAGPCR